MVHLIEKTNTCIRLKIYETACIFIPPYKLYVEGKIKPVKSIIPKGKNTILFSVNKKVVSSKQLSECIGEDIFLIKLNTSVIKINLPDWL